MKHQFGMKQKWPTLKGRLSQPITSRREALTQLKEGGNILTPWAEKELEKLNKNYGKITRF